MILCLVLDAGNGLMNNLQTSSRYERALSEVGQHRGERLLTIGTVIFSIAFCALVFHAGWRETVADPRCGSTALSGCQLAVTGPKP
jgi:hypothetical protein